MTVPTWIGIGRMRPAVHEDLAEAVDVALEQHVHIRWRLDELPRIGRMARDAGGQAIRFGIVFGKLLLHLLLRPGVYRNGFARFESQGNVFDEGNVGGPPEPGEIDTAIG